MKQIAFLEYSFMFDPSETWSNGYQFENQLADFFSAYGFEAKILASQGGTGRRIVLIERTELLSEPKKREEEQPNMVDTIKKIATKVAPKTFKEYQSRGVPKTIVNQEKSPPKLNYQPGGYQLRTKVKYG